MCQPLSKRCIEIAATMPGWLGQDRFSTCETGALTGAATGKSTVLPSNRKGRSKRAEKGVGKEPVGSTPEKFVVAEALI
jgi:hypothetical protein